MSTTIIPPTEQEYLKAKIQVMSYFVTVYACKKCGWPVPQGYCCDYCKSNSPSTTFEEDAKNEL